MAVINDVVKKNQQREKFVRAVVNQSDPISVAQIARDAKCAGRDLIIVTRQSCCGTIAVVRTADLITVSSFS